MLSVIVTAAVGLMVANAAFRNGGLRENWQIIKSYRPMHFIGNLPVIFMVIGLAYLLIVYVPFFDKNPFLWVWSTTFGSGDGSGGANLTLSGLQWKWYALIYLPVLMFALPRLAKEEEELFREGTRTWSEGIKRSIVFGLVHLIMMIPLGAALALSVGGLWFTRQYFKGGVTRSTTYHAVYNTMIMSVLFVAIISG